MSNFKYLLKIEATASSSNWFATKTPRLAREMCAECKCHTFIGNKICFILLFAFPRMLPFYLVADLHSNPMLTECSSCRAALFSGFSIPHTANIFHVFYSKAPKRPSPRRCPLRFEFSPLADSRLLFFHILHANRIFLNFNWIFDWLYLCLYTHISFGRINPPGPPPPPVAGRPRPSPSPSPANRVFILKNM